MRTLLSLACLLAALASPSLAQDLPKGPKAPPPEPNPEPICDTAAPSSGDWLMGRWVAPHSRWEFTRAADGKAAFGLEQKSDINKALGWKPGTRIDGKVTRLTGCTVRLEAGDEAVPAFVFEGVLTADGKVYGFAVNPAGDSARWILRRER
ncbi:hypothetical protein [Paramagnetospirillum marisnigri]|uniref:hypothetical protein n=1 Tax=Paramagnetospirillum marisnigri TaxID=1285242 RepID=UPI001FDF7FC3|nr:hypothetical protein [Paramagnetospirillum marisnigri]